jgi:hypothetical protein
MARGGCPSRSRHHFPCWRIASIRVHGRRTNSLCSVRLVQREQLCPCVSSGPMIRGAYITTGWLGAVFADRYWIIGLQRTNVNDGERRNGAPGRTRTSTMLPPPDFESGASTNSATGACGRIIAAPGGGSTGPIPMPSLPRYMRAGQRCDGGERTRGSCPA